MTLQEEIAGCRICADRFAKTATAHRPRPVPWFRAGTPILIAGQAPGMQVHLHGKPFFDRSGDRLRDWMGIGSDIFYEQSLVSVLPCAFCFPGYSARKADLPPPPVCAQTWHSRALEELEAVRLRILVGGHAIRLHLGDKRPVTEVVQEWLIHAPNTFVLPHPSWRNNGWIKRHPWFEEDLIPALRRAVKDCLPGSETNPAAIAPS